MLQMKLLLVTVASLMLIGLCQGDAEESFTILEKFLMEQENDAKKGFKDGRWYPHASVEGGADTIAYGHKLKKGEDFSDGLTEKEAIDLLRDDIADAEGKAKRYITEKYGADAWKGLSDIKKAAATEISFNVGGLQKFPKFTKALVNHDVEGIAEESKRVGLDRRNKAFEKTFVDPLREDDSGSTGGGWPDPHFRTLGGTKFDYHGLCDLIYMKSPAFGSNKGLDIHVRTQHEAGVGGRRVWSSIANVAIRIGRDVFEVANDGTHFFNKRPNVTFPVVLADSYLVSKFEGEKGQGVNAKKACYFRIPLGNDQHVTFIHWNDQLAFRVSAHEYKDFHDMQGLASTWASPNKLIGRDGKTDFSEESMWDKYGEQWQVQEREGIFTNTPSGHPQFPEPCVPAVAVKERYLKSEKVHRRRATEACAHVQGKSNEDCMFDVILTGDVTWAQAPWYGEF